MKVLQFTVGWNLMWIIDKPYKFHMPSKCILGRVMPGDAFCLLHRTATHYGQFMISQAYWHLCQISQKTPMSRDMWCCLFPPVLSVPWIYFTSVCVLRLHYHCFIRYLIISFPTVSFDITWQQSVSNCCRHVSMKKWPPTTSLKVTISHHKFIKIIGANVLKIHDKLLT